MCFHFFLYVAYTQSDYKIWWRDNLEASYHQLKLRYLGAKNKHYCDAVVISFEMMTGWN